MPRTRAILLGCLATMWMVIGWGALLEVGVVAGVIVTLLYDVPHTSKERRRLSKIAEHQSANLISNAHQLNSYELECNRLRGLLEQSETRAQHTLIELQRRDAVGAPEARKLIENQKETLDAQRKAMEEAQNLIKSQQQLLSRLETQTESGQGRWEETLATLERMLANQAAHNNTNQQQMLEEISDGNRELQRALTDLLGKLATEPRSSNVNVQDSVVMGTSVSSDVNDALSPSGSRGRRGRRIPKLKAVPIAQVGEPQRTTEEKWLRSLPEDLA